MKFVIKAERPLTEKMLVRLAWVVEGFRWNVLEQRSNSFSSIPSYRAQD